MNLKRIIKEYIEEDGFDWAREINPNQHTDFSNAVIGKTYRVEFDEILLSALYACNHSTEFYFYAEKAKVINIDYEIPYHEVYCGSENEEKVISLSLEFDLGEEGSDMFWVTDDMVTLYDIYENLNESEEEKDPFDWIRDTQPPSPHVPESGMKFKIKSDDWSSGVIYTITDITDTHMSINWIDPSDGEYTENFRWPLKHYFNFLDKGEIEIVYENLNESEDDFAWINDIEQTEIKFKKGDRVKIHNIGSEKAFIEWLGMYGENFKNGAYGKNIEGVVLTGDATNEFSLTNIETYDHYTFSSDEVYFPYQEKMEKIRGEYRYEGLNLLYEPI
jgi:hypothetical protein